MPFSQGSQPLQKTPARTKAKQSRATQNLKYAVSRWGASFSTEVNAAGLLKQQPSSHRARKVNSSADNKTTELGIFHAASNSPSHLGQAKTVLFQ